MVRRFSREEYRAYIGSQEWKVKRKIVARAKGYKCERCHKICLDKMNLVGFEVHHKTYKNFKHEKLSDLAFLCQRCHRIVHNFKYQGKKAKRVTKKTNITKIT